MDPHAEPETGFCIVDFDYNGDPSPELGTIKPMVRLMVIAVGEKP